MIIFIDYEVSLILIDQSHTKVIFDMVESNRIYLQEWLPFVQQMKNVDFIEKFVSGTMQKNLAGDEFAFVISYNNILVGRVGLYKIDNHSKIAEIGFWIVEDYQGKGIISKSCQAIIDFAFNKLNLNHLELKCGTQNFKSQKVAEKLGFRFDHILPNGEVFESKTIDLNVYSSFKNTDIES